MFKADLPRTLARTVLLWVTGGLVRRPATRAVQTSPSIYTHKDIEARCSKNLKTYGSMCCSLTPLCRGDASAATYLSIRKLLRPTAWHLIPLNPSRVSQWMCCLSRCSSVKSWLEMGLGRSECRGNHSFSSRREKWPLSREGGGSYKAEGLWLLLRLKKTASDE